jgi:ATP-binding cassette subfamily F protein uup
MALISLQNVYKKYDTKTVLNDISLNIHPLQKIAILGQNGQGKTTLMNAITKAVDIDSGEISIDKSITIEKLDQNPKFDSSQTVKEAIKSQLTDISNAVRKYDEISSKLATDWDNKKLLDTHSLLGNYLDHKDGWDIEDKIQRVMMEFKLLEFQDKPVVMLSGGEQRRVSLSAVILKNPDVLLLDEPTNHLDVHMVEYLENYLSKSNITLLFISHDRYFLDAIATDIYEIDGGNIQKYKGGYTDYLLQKEQLINTMQKEQTNLQKKLKEEILWMQKGVQARRKRNERRKKQYLELKEFIKTNPGKIKKMAIELQREQRVFNGEKALNKKKLLYDIDNICKTIDHKILIKNFKTTIRQKDCIAIVGANGCGKSTLLNILIDKLKPDSGTIKRGEFDIGYFDQNRDMLNDDDTLLETFCPNGGDHIRLADGREPHVYGYLKGFLFDKSQLDKKIGALSGGEKNRVALALLFTKKTQLLILDEPTNDLDIPTINILEQYLQNYQGAILFVSHDRYFVDKIAKKLFVFENDGDIVESYWQYSKYLSYQKSITQLNSIQKQDKQDKQTSHTDKQIHTNQPARPKPQKLSFNDKRELENLPQIIENLEQKSKALIECMNDKECYETKGLISLSVELENLTKNYDKKVER